MRVLWVSKASVTASYRKKIALLSTLGVEVAVVTGNSWAQWQFESDASDADYPIYRLAQRLSGRNHFHWYQHLTKAVDQFRPDLIHIDEEHYSLVSAQAVQVATARHIKTLFQSWQNIYKNYPWPFSQIEHYVFNHTTAAIAGTREVEAVLRRQGYHKPIHVVPLGVDTDIYQPAPQDIFRQKWGLQEKVVIGFVGRLVPEKGILDLLDALTPVLLTHPSWVLAIAGSGPLKETILTRSEACPGQVRLFPWLSTADMANFMNALDLIAVPSRATPRWKEQFGRVIVEAMAVKVPVIAYDSGEIANVIGDAGKIVPEGDVTSLRTALVSLLENPLERSHLAEKGYSRVLKNFSQLRVAELLKAVYESIQI